RSKPPVLRRNTGVHPERRSNCSRDPERTGIQVPFSNTFATISDANDWFANRDALSKPPLRFNNFGASLGGPVRVPHLYNGRDRTFFFLSIEDAVSVQPQPPVNVVVPSMEARRNAPPAVAAVLNAYPLPNRPYGSDGDADITGLARYVGAYSLRQSQ